MFGALRADVDAEALPLGHGKAMVFSGAGGPSVIKVQSGREREARGRKVELPSAGLSPRQ